MKYGHWHVARALIERAERVRHDLQRQYAEEQGDLSWALRQLLDQPQDVYSPYSWLPSVEKGTSSARSLPWRMSAEVFRRLPVYDQAGRQLLELIDDDATDQIWNWTPAPPDEVRFVLRDEPTNSLLHLGQGGELLRIQTATPPFPAPPGDLSTFDVALLIVLLLLSFVLGIYVLQFVVDRLFLLDADALAASGDWPIESGWGVWRCHYPSGATVGEDEKVGEKSVLDLAQLKATDDISKWEEANVLAPVISVEHFEAHIADAEWNQATLSLLDRLMALKGKTILVSSAISPYVYFSARFADAQTDNAVDSKGLAYFQRGVRMFAAFSAPTLVQLSAAAPTTAARHWAIWSQCSTAEKLAMVQLAKEGFVNPSPSTRNVVRRLLRRRLVRRDPAFCLMDDNFRDFVLGAETTETIAEWERAGGASIWSKLRMPLVSLLLLAVAFFFLTQPELFGKATGLVTAMSALVPIVVRVFGMLTEGRSSPHADTAT